MPITELLEENARKFGGETALVEIDPKVMEHTKLTWKEYALIETNPSLCGRSGVERYSICVIDRAVLGLPFYEKCIEKGIMK